MRQSFFFTPHLMVVGLAFLVPLALSRFKRFRLPIVVGEIVAGIAVGRSGLRLVTHEDALLHLLSELGFVFLMFLSGMEVDFSRLAPSVPKPSGKSGRPRWGALSISSLSFAVTLVLSSVVGFALLRLEMARSPWMMALILSTTSLGVVVPVLKERGLTGGRYGQTLLVAALIADVATMLLITIVVGIHSHRTAARILLVGVLFAAVFLMYRLGLLVNRVKAVRRTLQELSHATAQIKVRAAFALMLIFVALSEILGAEVILGAFMAGAIIALLKIPEDEPLVNQLEGIGFGFFIPLFFIMVGVDFNLPALFATAKALWLLPVLLGAAVVVKVGPALVFRLAFGWRETLAAGVLLSARLSLIIAAAAIGTRLGLIADSANAAIILVAIVTVTVAPPVFVHLASGLDTGKIRPIVVVGAGELGLQVAKELSGHMEKVVVVDRDPEPVERARQHGFEAIVSETDRYDPRLAPHLEKARALVCTVADTEESYRICRFVRTHYGIGHVVAQVTRTNELPRFAQLGVTTMNPALDRAALLVMLARNPAVFALLSRTDDDKEVYEFVVRREELVGKPVRDLKLPGDALILALRRNGELLVPHGNTRLEPGDELTLVGSLDAVQRTREELA
jgi:CPA2 family monovalent cation:H+ antiporter-2